MLKSWRSANLPALLGTITVVAATILYAYEQRYMTLLTPELASYYRLVAVAYLLTLFLGVALIAFDLRNIIRIRMDSVRNAGSAKLSPTWLIPYVLSIRKYKRFFIASSLAYGLFYAVITSMIVYQPGVDFTQAYGASIPSVLVTACCGAPLFTPVVTVYLVNHLGLLLIPLTLLLLIMISTLVGLNFALAAFAFDNRGSGASRGLVGGIGAAVGLFTGCPTCAGLFFANVLGGSAAVSFAATLAYYQPAFILLSIPVLLLTPYIISRSLGKIFIDGCVYLKSDAAQLPV